MYKMLKNIVKGQVTACDYCTQLTARIGPGTAKLGHKYKSTFKVCSETVFTKNLYHIENIQLLRFSNQMTCFYFIRVFTQRYFQTDYNYIFSLNVVIIVNFKLIQIFWKEV